MHEIPRGLWVLNYEWLTAEVHQEFPQLNMIQSIAIKSTFSLPRAAMRRASISTIVDQKGLAPELFYSDSRATVNPTLIHDSVVFQLQSRKVRKSNIDATFWEKSEKVDKRLDNSGLQMTPSSSTVNPKMKL